MQLKTADSHRGDCLPFFVYMYFTIPFKIFALTLKFLHSLKVQVQL